MAENFDPYHKWLGIPPKDQPPHHYRLLGIELFEADPQVIELAADRQMAYLRNFQTGPHSQQSQKLLSEVAQARICLLSAPKKATYDAELSRALQPIVPAAMPAPLPQNSAPSAIETSPVIIAASATSAIHANRNAAQRKRPNNSAKIVAGVAAGGVLLIVALALAFSNSGSQPKLPDHPSPAVAQTRETGTQARQSSAIGTPSAPPAAQTGRSSQSTKSAPITSPPPQVAEPAKSVKLADEPSAAPALTPSVPSTPNTNTSPPVSARPLPVVESTPLALPVTPLPDRSDGFVSLFNGKDLTGWRQLPQQSGGWSVEDGLLTGRGATPSHLFSERGDYRNFHLRTEALLEANGNSGLYFRCQRGFDLKNSYPLGYEAQIYNTGAVARTGSLYRGSDRIQVVNRPLVQPGEWFSLEAIAEGPRIVVKVNGTTVADLVDSAYQQGHIALQAMGPDFTVVRFRKIEIKELDTTTPPSPSTDAPRTVKTSKGKQKGPGVFVVAAVSAAKKEQRKFICELQDDGVVLREKSLFGHWEKQGNRYIIQAGDSESKEKITLSPRGRGMWSAAEVDSEGVRWVWEMQQASVVAVWRHSWPGGSNNMTLWSNGTISEPTGANTWTLQGNKLVLRWTSGFVDTVRISSDGQRYEGHNQVGAPITGILVEAPKND